MKQHLKTIEQPFIIEILDERFDNISIMLTDNALVYGSSLTSIISDLPADGDLDVAVSHTEFMILCQRFANSSKWKQIGGDKIRETDFGHRDSFRRPSFKTSGSPPFRPKSRGTKPVSSYHKYKPSKYRPPTEGPYRNISRTVTFETASNKRVQIIQAKEKTYIPLEDALSVIRAVDFVFCGIGIDKHGKLFEVIKSALDDCNNKIIHVANYHANLPHRFKKYIKHGWNLGISIDQAKANYLKKEEEDNKHKLKDKYFEITHNKKGSIQIEFFSYISKKLSAGDLRDLVTSFAKKMYGINLLEVEPRKYIEGGSSAKGYSYCMTEDKALRICDRVTSMIKDRFAVKKKKKFNPSGHYEGMAEFAEKRLLEQQVAPPIVAPLVKNKYRTVKWSDYRTKGVTIEEDAVESVVDDSPEEVVSGKIINELIYQI